MKNTKYKFNILQANINSLEGHKTELKMELMQNKIHAALLSETWTKPENIQKYNISGFHKIIQSRGDSYGGVGIYLKNNYKYLPLKLPTSHNFEVIGIKILNNNIHLISIYVNPKIPVLEFYLKWNDLLQKISKLQNVVLGGDLNAHNTAWGANKINYRGKEILKTINSSNLNIINNGKPTHYPTNLAMKPSAIDLSIVSKNLVRNTLWNVTDSKFGGNHQIIIFSLFSDLDILENNRKTIMKNKVYKDFKKITCNKFNDFEEFQNIAKNIIHKNSKKNQYNPKIWWSDELSQSYKTKCEARRIFNQKSDKNNLINLNKKEAEFKKLKKHEIRNKLNNLRDLISPQTGSSEAWTIIRRIRGLNSCQNKNNLIAEDIDMANRFMELNYSNQQILEYKKNDTEEIDDVLNFEMWKEFLNEKKKGSAPGVDNITYEMLKNLEDEVINKLIYYLNKMYCVGRLNPELKKIKVIAIAKAGKDQSTAEGYRPISLLPTLTKIINKAVLKKINKHVINNNIIPDTSFGFKKNSCTTTCLTYVTNLIQQSKREKNIVAAVFFDFTNAFSCTKTSKLISILAENNFPKDTITWIYNLLNNRHTTLETAKGIINYNINDGLNQGDILSPELFNIYTTSFHKIAEEGVVDIIQFADDFLALIKGKNKSVIEEVMQETVEKFLRIANDLNLKININKTKIMVFNKSNYNMKININNNLIENVKNYKYLGVILDKNLTFNRHINHLKSRVNDRLNMFKMINGIQVGSHPKTMLLVYEALITSLIMYGASVYGSCCNSLNKLLDTTYRKALRTATGCSRTTPNCTLAAIACKEPLNVRREYTTKREIARHILNNNIVAKQLKQINYQDQHPNKFTYSENIYLTFKSDIFSKIETAAPRLQSSNIVIRPEIKNLESKNVMNDNELKALALEVISQDYPNHIKIYTDASRNFSANQCSVGVYDAHSGNKISSKLNNFVSIMSAELTGIFIASEYIKHMNYSKTVIFTDSQASCKYIKKLIKTNSHNNTTWNICKTKDLTIQWIPAHVGIHGNEIADRLANEALMNDESYDNKILVYDAFQWFKKQKVIAFKNWYYEDASTKGRRYHNIIRELNDKPWFQNSNLRAPEIRTVNRLLAGHDFSNYWLGIMKIVDSQLCDVCGVNDDAEHIILFCVKYHSKRLKYKFNNSDNLVNLLKNYNEDNYREIIKYLQEINIKL